MSGDVRWICPADRMPSTIECMQGVVVALWRPGSYWALIQYRPEEHHQVVPMIRRYLEKTEVRWGLVKHVGPSALGSG